MKNIQFIILALLIITQVTIAQTIYTVDNRPESGAQFTSVQDAIDASADNYIIYIHPSPTTYGSVTINNKTNLTLVGMGHNPVNMDGLRATLANITFSNVTPNCVIKGLNFSQIISSTATNADGIQIINNKIDFQIAGASTANTTTNWIIEGNYFALINSTNITFQQSEGWIVNNNYFRGLLSNINHLTVITNNVFVNSSNSAPPTIFFQCFTPTIANNIFLFTGSATGVGVTGDTTNTEFNNCMTFSYTATTLTALPGPGNYDEINPQFVSVLDPLDFYNNNFNVTNVNALNGGTDGTDLGLFGNGFVFDINGRPDVLPYPTEMTIFNTVVQPGQTLNVNFKASQKQ